MHELGGELDDVAEAGALGGERRADVGEGLRALGVEIGRGLAVLAGADLAAMNRNSAFTRVICEYCPSGLPRLSGLRILMSGMVHSCATFIEYRIGGRSHE
jgi:hypothetical protein